MKKRSRAHEAGSIEAGSSKSKSIFFANRVDGAVVGAFACNQIDPTRAPRSAQGSQVEPVGAPRSAQSSQIGPARAPGAARSSHSRPDRPSKGARGSQIEPVEPRSSPPAQARALDVSSQPTCEPQDRQAVEQFRYFLL